MWHCANVGSKISTESLSLAFCLQPELLQDRIEGFVFDAGVEDLDVQVAHAALRHLICL